MKEALYNRQISTSRVKHFLKNGLVDPGSTIVEPLKQLICR
jgi:hypothetical protein